MFFQAKLIAIMLLAVGSVMAQGSDDGRPKTVLFNGKNYLVEQHGVALKITPQGTPVPIGVVNLRNGDIRAMDPNNYDMVKGVYEAYRANGAPIDSQPVSVKTVVPMNNSVPTTRHVEFQPGGNVIVSDPDLRAKVTIANEVLNGKGGSISAGVEFTLLMDHGSLAPPTKETWRYEGGLEPAKEGRKLLHGIKDTLGAAANSRNHSADAVVDICKNIDNCFSIVSESSEGKRKNEIGGSDVGGYKTYTGHDPKHALELKTAHALWLDLKAVHDATGKGETATLDFTSERFQREEAALKRIIGNWDGQ